MRGHWARYVALLGISTLLLGPSSAGAAGSFCEKHVVRDHLAPLKRLPKLNSPARLGFGPGSLRLSTLPPLVVNTGRIGFRVRFENGVDGPALDWLATTTLARVDWSGRVIEKLAVRRKRITGGPNSGLGFELEESDRPGPYRIVTVITNREGRELGRFGSYARLVPATQKAGLALSPGPYTSGGRVWARLENFGTATAQFGAPWRIERFNGTGWELAPESPRGPWILPLYFALPGHSSRGCVAHVSPTTPGRYRVVKEVGYVWPSDRVRDEAEPIDLTAEFDVLP